MSHLLSRLFKITMVAAAVPLLGLSAAIEANSVCQVGNCAAPDSIMDGVSSTGSFNFNVSVNGDSYNVAGNFNNTYNANGIFLGFFPIVTYIGGGPSGTTDTISLNMLQNIFDGSPGTWDGTYSEHIPFNLGSGVTATGQVFYGSPGQGIGLLTANSPGFSDQSKSAPLGGVGFDGTTLDSRFNYTFTFAAGSAPGTMGSSPIPEPMEGMLLATGLAGLFLMRLRAARSSKNNI